jgi:ATP-dependent Lon protease
VAESDPSELPIFELPLALVPAERVPLHIFEEPYRLMIGDCIERDVPFGIVLRDEEGARSIGCSALVAEVVDRHEDGRMDIVVRGDAPFRVLERFDADEWPAALVEMIAVDDSTDELADELEEARKAFANLLEAVGADPSRAAASSSAYPIAAQIEMPPLDKQLLLEEGDERERLQALAGSLRRLLTGLRKARRNAEHARSNGHRPGTIPKIE